LGGFFLYTGLGRIQRNTYLIRPPGSRSELDFMATCARCAQCMKSCPTNVIQPAVFDAGAEGFMTPQMDYRRGYCEWGCNECGKVCPTQAIRDLPLAEKHKKVIGRAYIDRNTCIPWAEGYECLVCQELCPVPEKAIILQPASSHGIFPGQIAAQGQGGDQSHGDSEDQAISEEGASEQAGTGQEPTTELQSDLMLPFVMTSRCIGCGVCEYNCPVNNEAAIRVRSLAQTGFLSR
jgi:Pyruvate/2-oxoacid:ferredoxin oxidoreductase delta subunit